MVTKCKDCSPSCEFCLYAERSLFFVNEKVVETYVKGCNKHSDEHHQSMARFLGYCEDFHCCKESKN